MLWLSAVTTPTCFIFAYLLSSFTIAMTFLLIIGFIPMLVTCFGFCYFVLRKPEKLQSEDYQIQHQTLQMVYEKSTRFDAKVTANILKSITNHAKLSEASKERE